MRLTAFVSYAHENEQIKNRLLKRLRSFEIDGTLSIWHDRKLVAGETFDREITRQIEAADFVLLLISRPFLDSAYCAHETNTAMARERARVIPVILEACEWHDQPFRKYNAVPTGGRAVASWPDEEQAFDDIVEHVARAVAVWRRVSNLAPRHDVFIGREDLLARLHGTEAAVLTGIDGAGKSALALEYAHRHAEEYSIRWWIRANDPVTLESDYAALAGALDLPERALIDEHAIVQAVKRHLAERPRWLLIFDDADDAANVESYLPGGTMGCAIVTSRNPPRPGTATPLAVDVLTRDESVELLLSHSGVDDREGADALAHELGDLPLALEQAAAFIERTASSFADYVESFRTARGEKHTIATTWKLSIDNIREVARPVMLCAFVAPDEIPRSLLNDSDGKHVVNKAVAAARAYSLIRADAESIGIHKLVQFVIRDEMSADERAQWARKACAVVNNAFPMNPEDSREWRPAARLLPHVQAACGIAEGEEAGNADAGPLLNRAGMYLRHRGIIDAALDIFDRAERWVVRFGGGDAAALAAIRANAAVARGETGDRAGSIDVFRAKLELDRRTYGDLHMVVALDLNNLGNAFAESGSPEEGLPILREAEALFEKLGIAKYLAVTKGNIAVAYERMGDLESSAKEHRAALEIMEKHYGPNNAKLIRTLYNLGVVEQSEARLLRAIEIAEREFGAEDAETYRLRLEAAVQAARKGDVAEAAARFKATLASMLEQYEAKGPELAKLLLTFSGIARERGYPEIGDRYAAAAEQIV
ncbi:MAG: FxSxx-COOH system tetratricopeptide repeat protein [Acidobacteriota bacterium]|nr:FxSxx-COOH system tetratricopeptide repeat protein [Acidobacteriota bacterium]